MPFRPNPNDELTINGVTYRVAEHPSAPGMPYGQEGRAGIVYRLLPARSGKGVKSEGQALKVFKPRFRLPYLVSQADKLSAFADLPGLQAARRIVLTPQRHSDLLRQYPDLTYAVLMPWIEGPTWLEIVLEKKPFTPEQSLALAHNLAEALSRLEQNGVAHCDLSGPNVILPALAGGDGIALIDLEGFYAPGMIQPQALSSGSAGYAHRQAGNGLWGPEADRFAGAVLLAEMLGWCDPQVCQAAWSESYFEPKEMQQEGERFRALIASLRHHWGDNVANIFERAWRSDSLSDCPTFGEWLVALPEMEKEHKEGVAEPSFTFRGGGEAQSLEELVRLCEARPDDAIWHLERGELENWLRAVGRGDLAQAAAEARQAGKSGPERLKRFLNLTGIPHHYEPALPGKGQEIPQPTPAPLSLEELRSQIYALVAQGQWKEALKVCSVLLNRWPDQGDIVLLSLKARHLAEMEEELDQAFLKAVQSSQGEDWERCWKAAYALLQQAPQAHQYQEIAERAQREMEWAAIVKRAETLLTEKREEEAAALLVTVPRDHPATARLHAQVETERNRKRRVAELLQQVREHLAHGAWDEAISACQIGLALNGPLEDFNPLLEHARREKDTEEEVAWHVAEADRAAGDMDWERAITLTDQALALRPQRAELRGRHEQFVQYRDWASKLEEARKLLAAHQWDQAGAFLDDIPDPFMRTAALKEQIRQEISCHSARLASWMSRSRSG